MNNTKYNRWCNYPTRRINLEILSGWEFEEKVSPDYLRDLVEDVVFSQFEMKQGSHLVEDYARAFVSEVNFEELADTINSDF